MLADKHLFFKSRLLLQLLSVLPLFDLGGEEAQLAGMSLMDSSRRRVSGLAMNSGTFAKQKSPIANDTAVPKDSVVRLTISYGTHIPTCFNQYVFLSLIIYMYTNTLVRTLIFN